MSHYKAPFGIQEISEIIPHRYPFLLVDKVTGFQDREWIEGTKNVTISEPFFQGHFPGRPIMPGVLMLESMAQLGAIFAKLSTGGASAEKLIVFSGLDEVRFRRPVYPGDVLHMRLELLKSRSPFWKMKAVTSVNGDTAVEGILIAAEV